MDKKKIQEILRIDRDFYKKVATDFSRTRQNFWLGWGGVAKFLKGHFSKGKTYSVLDLGCGNGRFYKFLIEKLPNYSFEYTGIDTDSTLLKEAKNTFKETRFEKLDIFLDIEKLKKNYDLVVGFGITHHLPGQDFRKEWFKRSSKLVKSGGVLIFSFWDFLYQEPQKAPGLEENDYYLGWSNADIKRYCHYYNEKELDSVKKMLEEEGFLVKIEKSDQDLNTYLFGVKN